VSEVASQPEKKRALQELFSAQAVDMETSALARLAAEKNIPFLSLRAISDSATDELMDVSPMLEPDGKVSPLKAGWYVMTHPGSLKNLLSLKDIAKKATDNLTQFLSEVLGGKPLS
jgi:adenosylhomocysteine nucleosidase